MTDGLIPGDTVTVDVGLGVTRTGTITQIVYDQTGMPWEIDVQITPEWTLCSQPKYVRRVDHG